MLNFFKKKTKSEKPVEPRAITTLCIPGNWKDQGEIVRSIAESNLGEYMYAGMVMMNLKTKENFELGIYEHDESMKLAFQHAGAVNGVSEAFLQDIDQHELVIYLRSETGDLKSAEAMARAGNAILKAGGIGIKIETSGKAFTREQWMELIDNFEESDLYEMFVLDTINDGELTYSCGMHNLGLKDSIVYQEDFQDAVSLLRIFGYYQLVDKPEIITGQTFSAEVNAPVYVIQEEQHQPNHDHEAFANPYGMWKLMRKA